MAIPMVRETHRLFPDAHITVFARDWVAPVYKFVDGINEIISFSRSQRKTYSSRRQLIRQLKDRHFDIAFLSPDSFSTAWLLYRSRISRRVGYTGELRSWMLTDRLSLRSGQALHRTDKYINMLRVFGSELHFGLSPTFDIPHDDEDFLPAEWDPEKFHIGINPFSVASSRRWLQEYWQSLIDSLGDESIQFVMFGGPNDVAGADKLASELQTEILIQTGKTSLEESIRLIARCDLFVSNDSGPMHIADAAGVPTLGFWGAGDISETGLRSGISKNLNANVYCSPCRKNQCINKKEPLICLQSLSPDLVRSEIRYFLKHRKFTTDKEVV